MTDDVRKKRVALLTIHPAPYRDPLFKRLVANDCFEWAHSNIFKRDYGHGDMQLGDDVDAIAADVETLNPGFASGFKIALRLMRKYSFGRQYDFVIWPAYAPWWLTAPVFAHMVSGGRYAVALDTVRDSGGAFSKWFKRLLFRRAAFLWVPGAASKRYLVERCGIDEKKVITGLYLPKFKAVVGTGGGEEAPVFLMVANNRPFRRMDVVKEGFEKYRATGGIGRLILCGKDASLLAGDGIETIEGVPAAELPQLYAGCDVYIHNGNEQFSTALLMGAMAEKPLISGVDVGVYADLFDCDRMERPGVSVEKWESPEAWAAAFAEMSASRSQWREMGYVAARRAERFVPEEVGGEVVKKIREGLSGGID